MKATILQYIFKIIYWDNDSILNGFCGDDVVVWSHI